MGAYPSGPPGRTALVDQAEAATREAADIVGALIRPGDSVGCGELAGSALAVVRQLEARIRSRGLTRCPHVVGIAPTFWCAWAPGRLRCADCADAANARIRGTREDRRCDACRRVVPLIRRCAVALPALISDARPAALGPIIAMYGVCGPCHRGAAQSSEDRAA